MFRTRLARVLLVPAALVLPASVATVALSSAAGAVTHATDSVKCSTLNAKVTDLSTETAKGTLSGCTDPKNTDAGGKFSGSGKTKKATITWDDKYGTTKTTFNFKEASTNECASPSTEFTVTGKVTSSTGKAKSIKKSQPVSADVCVDTAASPITVTLLPGTTFDM
jgi:hypothetical protein